MSASRMKNLILLVLTLCALGLLCIVVPNRLAQTHEQRQMLQELKTLYEGYDLSIDLDELPRSPTTILSNSPRTAHKRLRRRFWVQRPRPQVRPALKAPMNPILERSTLHAQAAFPRR